MRPPDPARRAVSNPRGFAVPAKTRPAAPALEGWYPRKYAYCTIYRK